MSNLYGWEGSEAIFGGGLRSPHIALSHRAKSRQNYPQHSRHCLWVTPFYLYPGPVPLTLACPFFPRESLKQLLLCYIPQHPALAVSSGAVLAEKSIPAEEFTGASGLMSRPLHKTCLHVNKGIQSKSDLNNEDFRCFVMTGQQGIFSQEV